MSLYRHVCTGYNVLLAKGEKVNSFYTLQYVAKVQNISERERILSLMIIATIMLNGRENAYFLLEQLKAELNFAPAIVTKL